MKDEKLTLKKPESHPIIISKDGVVAPLVKKLLQNNMNPHGYHGWKNNRQVIEAIYRAPTKNSVQRFNRSIATRYKSLLLIIRLYHLHYY